MSFDLKAVLKNKAINEWRLFWLIATPMSIAIVIAMMGADLSAGPGVSTMIQFSVRFAVPIVFLVIAVSALLLGAPRIYGFHTGVFSLAVNVVVAVAGSQFASRASVRLDVGADSPA